MKNVSLLLPVFFWGGWLAHCHLHEWMNRKATTLESVGVGLILIGVVQLIAFALKS